ncbi:hypothetical protein CPB83DRAFT_833866 [Crepidotus variabilis]|uniref:Uncharacterized protein n=1 Tax=Crepidotus variabilis TaxID=179855 RepID=A0A9P6JSS9_9AGAR|nr:hypothetical protein CPB83DRAFT_833866 [Crepidotus variabilis]
MNRCLTVLEQGDAMMRAAKRINVAEQDLGTRRGGGWDSGLVGGKTYEVKKILSSLSLFLSLFFSPATITKSIETVVKTSSNRARSAIITNSFRHGRLMPNAAYHIGDIEERGKELTLLVVECTSWPINATKLSPGFISQFHLGILVVIGYDQHQTCSISEVFLNDETPGTSPPSPSSVSHLGHNCVVKLFAELH